MSTFAKTVSVTSATSQAVTKVLGAMKNKTVTATAASGATATVIRSRTYNKTVSITAASGATSTVLRGRLKAVSVSAMTGVSASAVRTRNNIVSVSAQATCEALRAPSIFNRSVSVDAQAAAGVSITETLAGVYFYYPPNAPTTQIGLRNPRFGNVHSVHLQTVAKRSRNGVLYLFKRTPTYESFKLDFDRIDETRFQRLITFMKTTAGKQIQYKDHKGVKWNGYILTDPFELVNDKKGLNDRGQRVDWYTLSLQFEGSLA